jgi:hypothetical protein
MTGRRQREVSLIVKAAEAAPLRSVCQCPAGEIEEECGGDGEEAPGQPEADSLVSVLASMRECSADRETILAGVRNLADQAIQLAAELNQARKEVAPEGKRREVMPRHLRAERLARADGQAIVWRSEAAELRRRVDAATAKSGALLCQTRRQKRERAELNDRITQLNEGVEG